MIIEIKTHNDDTIEIGQFYYSDSTVEFSLTDQTYSAKTWIDKKDATAIILKLRKEFGI